MFPLAGETFPNSAESLVKAIRGGLEEVLILPDPASAVILEGGAYPAIRSMIVNLDGAAARELAPPPKPEPLGERRPGITTERLNVHGHPVRYAAAHLDLDLVGQGVRLDFDRDRRGHPLLVLAAARQGNVELRMDAADLQIALREAAGVVAKQHGVAIQDLRLTLTSEGSRALDVTLRVKAKKLIMSGVIQLAGRVVLDETLNATFSGLRCTGEGLVGHAVAPLIQGKLNDFEGRRIPLTAFSLGDVRLRDLKVDAGTEVKVSASFGGGG